MGRRLLWAALALVLAGAGWAAPNWSLVRAYVARPAVRAPTLDGRLDDPCWRAADVATDFVVEGQRRDMPAGLGTSVQFCYDGQALYAAFTCQELHLGKLTTTKHDRDFDAYTEDMVGLLLSPGHAAAGEYDMELAVTAAGTQYDCGWRVREAWNGEWTAATAVDAGRGVWTAELRIPWADTRRPGRAGAVWGVQATRWRQAGGQEQAFLWSAVPDEWEVDMWTADSFGHLWFGEADRGLLARHVTWAARRLQAGRAVAEEAVAGDRAAAERLQWLDHRLTALQQLAASDSPLTGDAWAGAMRECDQLLRDRDHLVWPLRIKKLLED